MSNQDMANEETEDRFYAQFDSREVELMTLDELAAAFDAGRIHENTFVCREGESEWLTLHEVAGLGDEEPEPEPAPVVVVAERRPPMPARRAEAVETRPPMPARRPEGVETRPPMPERRPEGVETRPPMPPRRAEMNTVPAARFAAVSATPTVIVSTPLSFAPVSSNLDFSGTDLDELALRPKRRWGRVLGAAAVLTLVGGGAAFALGGGAHAVASASSSSALEAAGSKSQASLTLDAVQAKPSEPAIVAAPAVPSTPEPAAEAAPAAPASDAPAAPGLSDDMKQALLAQDKTHASKHAAKVKARAASGGGVARRKAPASSGGFKSGGSAYDPLNGKL